MDNQYRQEVERKNHDFVQLRKGHMSDMRRLMRANPVGAEILFFLIENMDRLSNAMVASYTLLQERLGYSRGAVAKAVKALRSDHWIKIEKSGNMNVYCVNSQVAWQAANNQRHYAKFTATVMLSSSEQDYDVTKDQPPLKRVPAYLGQVRKFDDNAA